MPVEVQEGYVAVTGGRVWYQIVGEGHAIPLLVLHGGPGVPHDYLAPLTELADERPVVFYDQLGCGRSDRPDDVSLWRIDRFAEEIDQVRRALGLEQVHILAHSAGTMLALEYLLGQPPGVLSLIQVGPILSTFQFFADTNRLYATLPDGMYAAVQRHEAAGTMDSEEYQRAVKEYRRRYMMRIESEAETTEDNNEGFGVQVCETMWGLYELKATGNLKTFDRSARAHEVTAPMLFVCGRYDCCTPEETARYHQLVPGSEMVVLEQSAHSPFVEEPVAFFQIVRDFLGRVEARRRQ